MSTDSLSYSSPLAGALCQAVDTFSGSTRAALSSANALFDTCTTSTIQDTTSSICRFANNNFNSLQSAFLAAQALSSIRSSQQIIEHLGGKALENSCARFLTAIPSTVLQVTVPGLHTFGFYLPALVSTAALTILGTAITLSSTEPEQEGESEPLTTRRIVTALQIVGITQSLAFAILNQNRLYSVMGAAAGAYSLYKKSQIQETPPQNTNETSTDEAKRAQFEKAYAIYNAAHGILGCLQQIPEFTGPITALRRVLLLPDIALGVMAHKHLAQDLGKERAGWGILPVAASIPVFLGFDYAFGPADAAPPISTIGEISASWSRPLVEKAHLIIDAYRLVTSIGLAATSKVGKAWSALSMAGQVGGLIGSTSVHWLYVNQTMGVGRINALFDTFAPIPASLANNTKYVKNAIDYILSLQDKISRFGERTVTLHYTANILTHRNLDISYTMEKIDDLRRYLSQPFIWTADGLEGYADLPQLHFLSVYLYRG